MSEVKSDENDCLHDLSCEELSCEEDIPTHRILNYKREEQIDHKMTKST
jgi:hypothetical protein